MNELVQLVRTRRLALGFSIRRASAESGIPFNTLARLERGIGEPDPRTLLRMSRWLSMQAVLSDEALGFGKWVADIQARLCRLETWRDLHSSAVPATVESSDSTEAEDDDMAKTTKKTSKLAPKGGKGKPKPKPAPKVKG